MSHNYSAPTNGQTIQRDWHAREVTEAIGINIMQISQFLREFDLSTRYKLARINERLNTLERSLEYCELAFQAAAEEG